MSDVLGAGFAGSSNTYLAYKHDLEAIGTNAHELPMAMAALAKNEEELRTAQYRLLELWQQSYQGELLILLPDTFGTTQFLEQRAGVGGGLDGPAHRQQRSVVAGDEYIAWLERQGRDPRQQAADCLRCARCGADSRPSCLFWRDAAQRRLGRGIFSAPATFWMRSKWIPERRIRFSAGWGTFLTNDFRGCNPQGDEGFDPVSLVCKLTRGGRQAGGEALRQLLEGAGRGGRGGALPAGLWNGGRGGFAGIRDDKRTLAEWGGTGSLQEIAAGGAMCSIGR